jgi:hypothetical protein
LACSGLQNSTQGIGNGEPIFHAVRNCSSQYKKICSAMRKRLQTFVLRPRGRSIRCLRVAHVVLRWEI